MRNSANIKTSYRTVKVNYHHIMSRISTDDFMNAMTFLANQLGYENAYQLLVYAKVLEKPIPPSYVRPNQYHLNWDILHAAFGADDRVDTFELDDRLYAVIDTRRDRGDSVVNRTRWLEVLTFGRVQVGHEPNSNIGTVVNAYSSIFCGFCKSTIAWISLPKPDYRGTAYQRIMETTGSVGDHRSFFTQADCPKTTLWFMTTTSRAFDEPLRRIFPEMSAAYRRRNIMDWLFLLSYNPTCQCKHSGVCARSSTTHAHLQEMSMRQRNGLCAPRDVNDDDNFSFVYDHKHDVWFPKDLLLEYRFYRLQQVRLVRLLRQHTDRILQHLYQCPNGAIFKKTAAVTMVGRQT